MKTRVLIAFVLASGLALFCTPSANAVSDNFWNGAGGDANWTTAGNFSSPLATSSNLVFDGNVNTTNTNNSAIASFSGIRFDPTAGSFNIGGTGFTLVGPIIDNSTNTQTISIPLTLGGAKPSTTVVEGGNLILSGNLGASTLTWTKTGGGTLTLSGLDTAYTGTIGLSEGTLLLDLATNTTGVLGSTQAITFANGTVLSVKGASTGTSSQSLANLAIPAAVAVGIAVDGNGGSGTTLAYSGFTRTTASSLNATLASAGDALTFTTAPTNSNGIVPWATVTDSTGTGFGTASGTSLVRYTGATALSDGLTTTSTTNYKIAGTAGATLATGTNTVNSLSVDTAGGGGGTLDVGTALAFNTAGSGILVSGNNNYTIGGGSLEVAGGEVYLHQMGTGTLTINAPLRTVSSAARLIKDGSGTVVLGSAASGITAGSNVYISGGVLELDNSSALTQGSTQAKVFVGIDGGLAFGNGITSARIGDLNGSGDILLNNTTGGAVALQVIGASTATYTGVMSGLGSFEKQGTGNLTLSIPNTYAGATAISGTGIVTITGVNVLPGTTTVTLGTSTESGSLDMRASQTITGLTNGSFSGSRVINQGGSAATLTVTGESTFGGNIQNNIALTKSTAGTLTLTGSNSYTGATKVTGGALQFGQQVSLYAGTTASWTAANITVNSGAMLALNVGGTGEFTSANIDTLKALGTGTTGFTSGSVLGLDTSNASGGNFVYTSAIGNPNGGANVLGITKRGTGTLTLGTSGSPVTQTYTGATTVTSGTLVINGTLQNGGVTVSSGATLGGNITAGGTTTIQSGGTLSVGNSPGTGNFDTLTLAGTTITQFNDTASRSLPGTDYDTINITTGLTYGGELRLTFAGAVANDAVNPFDLFAFGAVVPTGSFGSVTLYNSSGQVGGSLTNASGVWSGSADLGYGTGSQLFTFSQTTGNLMVVPEPSTYGMFIGGLTLLGLLAAHRRRVS